MTTRRASAVQKVSVLTLTGMVVGSVLVLVVDDALDFMLKLDTALTLIPYLLAASSALKLTINRKTYTPADEPERRR